MSILRSFLKSRVRSNKEVELYYKQITGKQYAQLIHAFKHLQRHIVLLDWHIVDMHEFEIDQSIDYKFKQIGLYSWIQSEEDYGTLASQLSGTNLKSSLQDVWVDNEYQAMATKAFEGFETEINQG